MLLKILAMCSNVNDRSFGNALVNDRLMKASWGMKRRIHKTTITTAVVVLKPFSVLISLVCLSLLWSLKIRSNTKEMTAGTSKTKPAMLPLPYWKEDIN